MEITTNMFIIVASLVLFLYVIFVFVLFLPMIGFGIMPVMMVALFAGFCIIISIFYNNYDPDAVDKDYDTDSIYIIILTITSIVFFLIVLFVMWMLYTRYSTGKETPIEDISQEKNGIETPFTSNKNY